MTRYLVLAALVLVVLYVLVIARGGHDDSEVTA